MTGAGPVTAGQQEAEASRPLIMVSYLCLLTNQDALPEVRLKDLRDLHPELIRAGVHPVMETTTLSGAVESLLGLPGLENTGVTVFVIRGEAVITAEYLVLLSREFDSWNRADLTALLHDAQSGDRVVMVGLCFNEHHQVEGLSGVYRVFTLA
ncbi:hypothetical protein [Deinococcus aquaticus]|uniref:hypothetical protein n=1 Tax=Deinococcus aquaticus TaxID=328692 RepID=UPI003F46E32E